MYTVLTSFPDVGSGNIGDKLIEIATKKLIKNEKGKTEFLTVFREDDLSNHLDEINKTRAVIMPAFPIRDLPMYPGVYKLVDDLREIHVPLIPVGGNWNVYPGDFFDRQNVNYSKETIEFLKYISLQTDEISCREYHVCRILERHNIENSIMTGDPSWFDLDFIGRKMKRPTEIKKLVFTPPLSAFYVSQAKSLIKMLASIFPRAEKYCTFHLGDMITNPLPEGVDGDNSAAMNRDVAEKNERIRQFARKKDFGIVMANHDINKIDFYEQCDLHVGYECHAHWGFLRKRVPSILVSEDARGVGFSYTQGVGGFEGFVRSQSSKTKNSRPTNTSGYCDSLDLYGTAPADMTLAERVREFIEDELESNFRRYVGYSEFLDEIYYTRMKPFIASLP